MENIHGGDIYQYEKILDFSANINPLGAPDSVKKALTEAIGQIGCYPEMYSESLRKAIGTKYHIEDSQIICGNGAAECDLSVCLCCKTDKNHGDSPLFCGIRGSLLQSLGGSYQRKGRYS